MEEKTEIKPSLTDPNTSATNSEDSLSSEDSDKAKEISPPSNLPKETSKPVPVPVVNYTADESKESEDASVKNKIPEIAKEVKEIAKEIEKADKKLAKIKESKSKKKK